jgi:hypothetical protein
MENTDSHFDIELTVEEDLILVTASGEYSLVKANNLFKFSIDNVLAHNKNKILVDVTSLTGSIPFFDRYQYAEFLANYKAEHASKIHKIAVVGKEPIVDKDRFGETVAVNRGVNGRVFTEMSQALAWLDTD